MVRPSAVATDSSPARTRRLAHKNQSEGRLVNRLVRDVGGSIGVVGLSRATVKALSTLDKGFFRVRFDRLTPREKQYMRAMAELGSGPHRSGDIAELLGVKVTTISPLGAGLIGKGMI